MPQVVGDSGGVQTIKADMLGELVRVPEEFREQAEQLTGELTPGLFPIGLDVDLAPPNDHLNGVWVQRDIYNHARDFGKKEKH